MLLLLLLSLYWCVVIIAIFFSIFDMFLVAPMKLSEAPQLVRLGALHKFCTLHAN